MASTTSGHIARKLAEIKSIYGGESDEKIAGRIGLSREHVTRLRKPKKTSRDPQAETIRAVNRAYEQAIAWRDGQASPTKKQREKMAAAIQNMLSDDAIAELYPALMQYVTQDMMGQWGQEPGPLPDALAQKAESDESAIPDDSEDVEVVGGQ